MSFASTLKFRQDVSRFQAQPSDSFEPTPIVAQQSGPSTSMINVYNNVNNALLGSSFPRGPDGILSTDFFTAKCAHPDFAVSQQENLLRLRSSLNNVNNMNSQCAASCLSMSAGSHGQQQSERNGTGASSVATALGASQAFSLQNLKGCYMQSVEEQEQSGRQQQTLFAPQPDFTADIGVFDAPPTLGGMMDGEQANVGTERISNAQQSRWQQRFNDLVAFRNEYGNCCVPTHWPQNPPLAQWVKRQRYQYKLKLQGKHSTMTDSRLQVLNDLGMVWDPQSVFWEERLAELMQFQETYGHCNVPTKFPDHPELAIWVKCQRRQFKIYCTSGPQKSNITPERISKLRKVGFVFSPREAKKHNNAKKGVLSC